MVNGFPMNWKNIISMAACPSFLISPPTASFLLACYPLLMLAEDLILEAAKIISAWEPLQLLSLYMEHISHTFPLLSPSHHSDLSSCCTKKHSLTF